MFNSFSILLPFQARERIYDKSDDELNHEDDTDENDPSKPSSEPDVIVHDEKSVGAANEPATSEIALQPAFDMTPQTEGRSFNTTGTSSPQPQERVSVYCPLFMAGISYFSPLLLQGRHIYIFYFH